MLRNTWCLLLPTVSALGVVLSACDFQVPASSAQQPAAPTEAEVPDEAAVAALSMAHIRSRNSLILIQAMSAIRLMIQKRSQWPSLVQMAPLLYELRHTALMFLEHGLLPGPHEGWFDWSFTP